MNQRGFAHIFLFLIAAVIIAILFLVGYYYWSLNYYLNETPLPSPRPAIEDTNYWETYTNKTYGFSIKHPRLGFGEGICRHIPMRTIGQRILLLADQTTQMPDQACYYFKYYVSLFVTDNTLSVEEKINKLRGELKLTDRDVSFETIYLDDKLVTKMKIVRPPKTVYVYDEIFKEDYYFFQDPINGLQYTFYVEYRNSDDLITVNKILSSLDFDNELTKVILTTPFYKYFPSGAFTSPDFKKRNYIINQAETKYISSDYYSDLDALPDNNLVSFKCSYDITEDSKQGKYFYSTFATDQKAEPTEVPIGAQLYYIMRKDPRTEYKDFQYCLTSDNKEYMIASNNEGLRQIVEIENDSVVDKAQDSLYGGWPHFCDVLAMTRDDQLYLGCGMGDLLVVRWINKVDLNSGKSTKLIECRNEEDLAPVCTRN